MVTLIAVVGRDGSIGRGGDLIRHLPEDLRHFKSLTLGHPVIMGRKTWESLPKRPLPKRRNIVVTRNPGYHAEGAEVVGSLDEALRLVADDDSFIMGGGQIYAAAIAKADRLELTLIDEEVPDADTFFPEVDSAVWRETASAPGNPPEGCPPYRFVTFERI